MEHIERMPAVLLLQDGTVFRGRSAGLRGTAYGEICFNTGMTGYQEIFTDPSYFGQIMVTTNAHIGNYGVRQQEAESASVKIAGLVCRNFNLKHYRPQSQGLQEYFIEQGVVAISDVDTRALVRHIRRNGAMNAVICSEDVELPLLQEQLEQFPSMSGLELASRVSTPTPYTVGNDSAHYRVAVMDYGVKQSILRCFDERDCYLRVFPADSPYEEVKRWDPDGIFLSNGPGDPSAMGYAVEFVRQAMSGAYPIFGICLGHQLLALALGVPTYKMHHGHRGLNHPVYNLLTKRSEITSQNHGFAVDVEALRNHPAVEITHINLNDHTIEGIRCRDYPAFSVQYHPESSPGPHDSRYLFDDFVRLLQSR